MSTIRSEYYFVHHHEFTATLDQTEAYTELVQHQSKACREQANPRVKKRLLQLEYDLVSDSNLPRHPSQDNSLLRSVLQRLFGSGMSIVVLNGNWDVVDLAAIIAPVPIKRGVGDTFTVIFLAGMGQFLSIVIKTICFFWCGKFIVREWDFSKSAVMPKAPIPAENAATIPDSRTGELTL